ncbi:beta-glucosidase BglX [Penaeicola halotolerans]|uniref:beta-glucosidase BglX n=1 Tax=Penaeicola halotolerans TaxID=2793196 RepID=UPI001CF80B0E|nr:beta-glucosidase BglX [Penaeicola halotolerans]
MNIKCVCIALVALTGGFYACDSKKETDAFDPKVTELLSQMTLEEKAGQLNFVVGDLFTTGPDGKPKAPDYLDEAIKKGEVTGIFNIYGAEYTQTLQKKAVEESRLGIPLLIGADIIHGLKTIMPIPLAEAASWDLEAIELGSRVAARESAAAGINLTFAPMVDISRDARWGRNAEGAGEDTYLGSLIAAARVRGFQGSDLSLANTIAACVKHFAAYGAAEAGRDYNTVDMSDIALRETYLPPFKAAIDAGAASIMTSFNELNGVPASGNEYLLQDILRKEWGFEGLVISDWQSISEMMFHGYSKDSIEATIQGINAGTELDMMADLYLSFLPQLVREGKVSEAVLDRAVGHILQLKVDLGLFDNPYLYSDPAVEAKEIRSAENLEAAFEIARRSIVLLKNEKQTLPVKSTVKRIAVIGPLGDNQADMNGTWSFFAEALHPISFLEGIKAYAGPGVEVTYAQGCNLYDNSTEHFAAARAAAQRADLVILAIGESAVMNGEGASRSDITLPGIQQELVNQIAAVGKPTVALVSSGRALALTELEAKVDAILATWTLGSQAGKAVASVLFGEYNPAGKLPVTFPRSVGQVPIYYNHKNTGRPFEGDFSSQKLEDRVYRSRYRDVDNSPLYPFGYGLSYTTFEYSQPVLNQTSLTDDSPITVTVKVSNTGDRDGEEVVQLYTRDLIGSLTRPVKELKGFQKIHLKAGESRDISFELKASDLAFWRADGTYGYEPGDFKLMIGGNSRDTQEAVFSIPNP